MRTARAVGARGAWVGLLSLSLAAHAASAGMAGPSWGKPLPPAVKPPPPPRMAAGYQHSLYVALDGTLWAWGDNTSGQLGDATLSSRTAPAQVLWLEHVVTVAAGRATASRFSRTAPSGPGVTTATGSSETARSAAASTPCRCRGSPRSSPSPPGTITRWPCARTAPSGPGASTARGSSEMGSNLQRATPVQLPLMNVVSFAAGRAHSLAVTRDGWVWAWGENVHGQLGSAAPLNRYAPEWLPGVHGVKAVAAGSRHSLALLQDGTVWAWGDNRQGQLGDGSLYPSRPPEPVLGLSQVVSIAAGGAFSLAVTATGDVFSWGANNTGQLGEATTSDRATPVPDLSTRTSPP